MLSLWKRNFFKVNLNHSNWILGLPKKWIHILDLVKTAKVNHKSFNMVNVNFFFLTSNIVQTQSHPRSISKQNRWDRNCSGRRLWADKLEIRYFYHMDHLSLFCPVNLSHPFPWISNSEALHVFQLQYSMFSMFTPSELLSHCIETACPFICLVHLSESPSES